MTHITSTADTRTVARCPRCARPSARVHRRYTRAPRDLPVREHTAQQAHRARHSALYQLVRTFVDA